MSGGPDRKPHVMNWDLVVPPPPTCTCPGCVRKPGHPGWHTTSPAAAAQEDAKVARYDDSGHSTPDKETT